MHDSKRCRLRFYRAILVLGLLLAVALPGGAGDSGEKPLAYEFTYEDINPASPTHGQKIPLSRLYAERGVMLNFIASWCGPCWKELPYVVRLHADEQTPIALIAADEYGPTDDLLRLAGNVGVELPILHVPTRDIEMMERHYDHPMLPATYVIDREGRIVRMIPGVVPESALVEMARKYFPPAG